MIRDRLSVENEIVASLRRITRAVDLHSRQLLEEYGLTGPQLAVLQQIADRRDVSASILARSVHLSRPTVTGILERLEKRGLVARRPDPRDRRAQQVTMTAAGQQVLDRAPSLLQDRFRRELATLEDWEHSQMLATLQRIAQLMAADEIAATPVLVAGPVDSEDPVHSPSSPAGIPVEGPPFDPGTRG